MATTKDIKDAVFSRMDSINSSLPVSYPGKQFTTPNSGMWFELTIFPNEPEDLGWEDTSKNMSMGFIQVSLHYDKSDGEIPATEEAEKVVAHFPKGLVLGPVTVRKKPWLSPSVVDDSQLFIPITIPYKGIT